MPAARIIVVTVSFGILSGSLWYYRPNPHIWLFGSVALGCGWSYAFFRLITRQEK
jgi:hypothetical protein